MLSGLGDIMIMNTVSNNSVSGCLFATPATSPAEIRFSANGVSSQTYSKNSSCIIDGTNVTHNITYKSLVPYAYVAVDENIPQKLLAQYSSSSTPTTYYTPPTTFTYTYRSSTANVRLIQDHILGNSPSTKLNGVCMGDFHAKAKLALQFGYSCSLFFDSYANEQTFQSETPKIEVEFDVINGVMTNITPHIENSMNIYVSTATTTDIYFYIYEIGPI